MTQPATVGATPRAETAARTPELFASIAAELDQVDLILDAELSSRRTFVRTLIDHVSCYRGKRLRPALLLLVARAAGEIRREHLVLAAVVEMIHTATLVHDDVLDQALVRRHKATVQAEWGTETSVLLGDYLFTHAFHLAASLESTLACRLIGRATNRVCEGELHQIHRRGHVALSEAEYMEIIDGKTAELCAVSCELGALFAGVPPDAVEALERYGRNLGMAFQIADDLLDLVGEERQAGKSLGRDAEQRKLTLPMIWLIQHGPAASQRQLQTLLAGSGETARAEIRAMLESSGAIGYASARAGNYAAAARAELDVLADSPARQVLVLLTQFVVNRSC